MLTIVNVYHVDAYQDGDYYIEDFESFANGENDINSSISDYVWLRTFGTGASDINNGYWEFGQATGSMTTYIYKDTTNLIINGTLTSSNSISSISLAFYNAENERLFYINENWNHFEFYADGLETTIITGMGTVKTFTLNATLNITTLEYHFNLSVNDGSSQFYWDGWTATENNGYIYKISHTQGNFGNGKLNYIKINNEDSPFLWENIESDIEEGSVTLTGNELSAQLSTFNNFVIENDFIISSSINLKRLALSIGENTDIDNLDIQLRIGDNEPVSYDNYYSYEERYILVWNLNQEIISSNPQFEINFIKTGGTPDIKILYTSIDNDNDADVQYKYSYELDNYNGVYDGDITENYDLIYKLWYNYTDDDIYDYGDLTDYTKSCSISSPSAYQELLAQECNWIGCWNIDTEYIETRFNVRTTATIEAVDLYLGSDQYDLNGGNLELYQLFINGEDAQEPDLWVPLADGNYILRWLSCNIPLDNEYPLFEFRSLSGEYNPQAGIQQPPYFSHWVSVGTYNKFERVSNIYAHGMPGLFGNNILDGEQVQSEIENKCICMCYYTDTYDPNPLYNDSIIVQPIDQTVYEEYDVLTITGTISAKTPTSYVQLWKDDMQITDHGYGGSGKKIDDYNFLMNFPLNSESYDGSWEAHIHRSGSNVSTYAFTVEDRDDYNGHLYTYPNPSGIGDSFTVGFLYNKTYYDNNNGIILWGRYQEFNDNYPVVFSNIQENGERSYSHNKAQTMYFFLCVDDNGDYTPISTHTHYVGEYFIREIRVLKDELYLKEDYEGNIQPVTQTFVGYHSYTGSDIYILDNGDRLFDVSSNPSFDLDHTYYSSGYHNITLSLYDGSSYTTLASDSFVIYDYEPGADIVPGINSIIPGEYMIFLGCALIVGLALAPSGLVLSFNKNFKTQITIKNEIILYISIITGFIGYVLTILWGIFPWWTIFALLFILILVFGIKWYSRSSAPGE